MRPPAQPRVPPKPAAQKPAASKAAPKPAPKPAASSSGAGRRGSSAPAGARRAPQQRVATSRSVAVGQPRARSGGRPAVSTAMAARLAERAAMRRHRLLVRIAWWVGGAAAAVAVGWVAFFSPLLTLEADGIEITGQGTTIDVEAVRAVVVPEVGVPMPRLDTIGLRNRILELNGVKDVAISRNWPHGLGVTLTSREPVAAVPADDGLALIDADGVRVGTAAEAPEGLPLVEVGLGEADAPALTAALHVLAGLPPDLAAQVVGVTASTRDDVRTTLASGQVVRWGSESRMTLKSAVVRTLQQAAPEASVLDVSSPDLPVTR